MLASGLAHPGIYFAMHTATLMLVWGVLYALAGITQIHGIRIGSWLTIVFVRVGVGNGA